ncbi:hypothetical protein ACICHK_14170 [Streptomyces sp. AHU1]|uniref:hypothetical protein n=1 Tax=Streptomyces sp. AHU1 TaxID=3377215 RepID=UPI0038783FDF
MHSRRATAAAPFGDGSARAAPLTLVHVPAREGVVLPDAGPLRTTRHADAPGGAADPAALDRRRPAPAPGHR